MRLVFFGTPRAAVPSLRELARSRHEIAAVVSQPDRPAHRGRRLTAPPVKDAAAELGLAVLQPESVRTAAFREAVAALRADAFAVVAYGHILGPKLLALAPRGAYNLHFSLLPRWRGAAPVQRAMLAGDRETGVSVIRLVQELDAGPVLLQQSAPVEDDDTAPALEARLAQAGAPLLVHALDLVASDRARPTPQDERRVTLAPPLQKGEGDLDASRDAAELERAVRALQPWPGTRLRAPRGSLAVLRARAAGDEPDAAPGTVLGARGEALAIRCGRGVLLVDEARPEGKAAMSGRSVLNGRLVAAGDRLADLA